MSKRQITIKPTCMRELLAFPSDRVALLWEKINLLVTDPLPDGKVKKKLKAGDGIYRLRVADHRVFYQFGRLGLAPRDPAADGGHLRRTSDCRQLRRTPDFDDDLDVGPEKADADVHVLERDGASSCRWRSRAMAEGPWVSRRRTRGPVCCAAEDDLLDLRVPREVLARVLDAIFPPSLGGWSAAARSVRAVDRGPRPLQGRRSARLPPEARRGPAEAHELGADRPDDGQVARGRARAPSRCTASRRCSNAQGDRPGASALHDLHARAPHGDAAAPRAASHARSAGHACRSRPATRSHWRSCRARRSGRVVRRRRARCVGSWALRNDVSSRPHLRRSRAAQAGRSRACRIMYLLEEFDWIMTGAGSPRKRSTGGAAPGPRRRVFRRCGGRLGAPPGIPTVAIGETVPGAAARGPGASSAIRTGRGTGTMSSSTRPRTSAPLALALMAETCRCAEGLFFAADSKQSLYSRNYTWTSANPRLQFRAGRRRSRRNYRSTAEIDGAAFSVASAGGGRGVEPSTSVHEGPMPVLLRGVIPPTRSRWIARFVRQMSRHLHCGEAPPRCWCRRQRSVKELAPRFGDVGCRRSSSRGRDLDLRQDV